ncbi:MAG TPA: hypothetical protein VLL52_10190 [Anaerolineae bacterium]|nr:hypothetical protein [Anaerolineae bacterium]
MLMLPDNDVPLRGVTNEPLQFNHQINCQQCTDMVAFVHQSLEMGAHLDWLRIIIQEHLSTCSSCQAQFGIDFTATS